MRRVVRQFRVRIAEVFNVPRVVRIPKRSSCILVERRQRCCAVDRTKWNRECRSLGKTLAEPSFGPLYPLSLTEEKPPTELPVNIVGIEGNEDLFRRTGRELSFLSGML